MSYHFRETSAKDKVRNFITDSIERAAKRNGIKNPGFVTLCDGDIGHQIEIKKRIPKAEITSFNFNKKEKTAAKTGRLYEALGMKKCYSVCDNIFNWADYVIPRIDVFWFDFCATNKCWQPFFSEIIPIFQSTRRMEALLGRKSSRPFPLPAASLNSTASLLVKILEIIPRWKTWIYFFAKLSNKRKKTLASFTTRRYIKTERIT